MNAEVLKKRKIALLKLGEAVAACEEAGVEVAALGNGGPVSIIITLVDAPGALPTQWLYDSDDHGGQPALNFTAVELALKEIGVTI